MKLAVAQPLTISHDVVANVERHADLVRVAQARVVVFPELSLTGYELEASALVPTDPRLQPLTDACERSGTVVLAGAPTQTEADDHISMLMFGDGEPRVVYNKLFLGEVEAIRFSPGTAPVVVEVDGVRLGLAICKDTGVAQHAADTCALGVDIYVAGVVEHAVDTSVVEERALRTAHDHGVWIATASCAGATGGGFHQTAGGSGIWRPDGTQAARTTDKPGEFAIAEI